MTLARLTILVGLAVAAAGCGGGEPDDSREDARFPLAAQADPPDGVPATVEVAGSATGAPCSPVGTRRLAVERFDARAEAFEPSHGPFRMGETVAVCARDFEEELPVDVMVRPATGRPVTKRFPAGESGAERTWTFFVGGAWKPGVHEVVARQRGEERRWTLRIAPAAGGPAVLTSARFGQVAGEAVEVLVTGQERDSIAKVDVYDFDDTTYRYRTTFEVRTDGRGQGRRTIRTRRGDAATYLFKPRDGRATAPPDSLVSLAFPMEGRPLRLPPGERPRSVFQSDDAPPRGVARQIAYFQEGGPGACDEPATSDPTLVFRQEEPREFAEMSQAEAARPEVGDDLYTCFMNFAEGQPVEVTITDPAGRRTSPDVPAQLVGGDYGWAQTITPEHRLGRYEIAARQGARSVRASYTVTEARSPGYEVDGPEGAAPHLLVVGLRPRQDATLLVYRTPDDDQLPERASTMKLRATYVGKLAVKADERGIIDRTIPRAPGDKGCYVIKVAFDGRVLLDASNSLSLACL